MRCANCDAELGDGPLFCPECGADVDQDDEEAAAQSSSVAAAAATTPARPSARGPMQVCTTCGCIAPTTAVRCDACGAALLAGRQPTVPERADGRFWVMVRARFRCRHCGHLSPVNHVDVDGTFSCMRCSFDQAADPGVWREALRFCHDVGDLSGPSPEGRAPNAEISIAAHNPHADIGVSRATAEFRLSETIVGDGIQMRSLNVDASPGVPLCGSCRRPVDVESPQRGTLTSRCSGCGETASYGVAEKAWKLHGALVGAIADDHRSDRADVRLQAASAGGPIALTCPVCGAALQTAAQDHFTTCVYCKTPSKIPSRTRAQLFREAVEADRWWLLFEGPSGLRDELEKKARADQARRAKQQEKQRQREASRAAPPAPRRKKLDPEKVPILALCAVFFIAAPALAYVILNQKPPAAPPVAAPATPPQPAPPSRPAEPVLPPRGEHTIVRECACKARDPGTGKTTPIELALKPELSGRMSMGGVTRTFVKLNWFVDVGDRHLRILPDSQDAPPPAIEGLKLDIAVGCDRDVVAVVAAQAATGWSTRTGERVWRTALPGAQAPRTGDGDLVVSCHKTVTQGGVISVLPAPGASLGKTRIRIADGKVL